MEPRGVRCQCPDCTLSVVMTSEHDIPHPITKVIEGTPYCPNCDQPMKPVASVDTTVREKAAPPVLTLEDAAKKCSELEKECSELAKEVEHDKKAYQDTKKLYDGKVVSLRVAVARMGRLLAGETIQADLPLFTPEAEAAAAEDVAGPSVFEVAAGTAGHELQQRFKAIGVDITIGLIEGWSAAQYDQALRWLETVDGGGERTSFPEELYEPAVIALDEPPMDVAAMPEPEPEEEPESQLEVGDALPVPIESGRRRRSVRKAETVDA